jgi:mono/diheme cytochrome c family protein
MKLAKRDWGDSMSIPLITPSPRAGEGWGEGDQRENHLNFDPLSPPPIPSPLKGEAKKGTSLWRLVIVFFLLPALWGCDYARMNDQESVRTYKKEIPEMPSDTIPITGGLKVLSSANPKDLKNPVPYTQESVDQGKEAYSYFCVQCHGPKADGNGTVGQSFAPLPANLRDAGVQKQSDGELFVKISLGFRRHPPLASTVSEPDRWAVVNYIRSLKNA